MPYTGDPEFPEYPLPKFDEPPYAGKGEVNPLLDLSKGISGSGSRNRR